MPLGALGRARAAAAAAHAVHLLEHALRDLELELRPRAGHDGEAARRRRPQAGPAPRHFGFRVGVRPAEGCSAMRQGLRFGFRPGVRAEERECCAASWA